jgi:microcystin-dependent protein
MDDSRISQLNLSNQLSGVEQVPISQFSNHTGATHTVHTTVDEIKNYVLGEFADAFCPIGTITPYAGSFSDNISSQGWLLCDGREVLQVDYPKLFERIGFAYGAAGEGMFKLPNLRGRVVTGYCSTSDSQEFDMVTGGRWPTGQKVSLGSTGGEYYRKLLAQDVPLDDVELKIPAVDEIAVNNQETNNSQKTDIFTQTIFWEVYVGSRDYFTWSGDTLLVTNANKKHPPKPAKIQYKNYKNGSIIDSGSFTAAAAVGSSKLPFTVLQTDIVKIIQKVARNSIKITTYPSRANNFSTTLYFFDDPNGGYATYSCTLEFTKSVPVIEEVNSSTVVGTSAYNILTPTDLNTPTIITQPYMVMNYIIKY